MGRVPSGSGAAAKPKYPTSALVRVDLATGAKTELFKWNSTFYKKLCRCSLPIRAQDQADLTVSVDGRTVWVVLSYNDKPNSKHESLISRGM